jgi:hypothetical protein
VTQFDPATLLGDYRAMLDGAIADARADLSGLQAKPKYMTLAAVYLTVLQSTIEAANALRAPTITIGGVVRSILESYADLHALARNPLYARRMLATLYEQRCKLFQDMLTHPANQYHASLAQQLDPAAELAQSTQQLNTEKAAGYQPLNNYDRMDAAGLSNEYRSLYWQLCLESHNSIATIEARHIDSARDGVIRLVLERDNPPGTMLKYLDSLVSMLIEASLLVYSKVNPQMCVRWQRRQADLHAYRSANIPVG